MKWVNGKLVETKYDGPTHASNNAGSPMEATKQARVVVMSKATYDQAREALRAAHQRLMFHERCDQPVIQQIESVLSAMEATHP